MAKHPRNLGVLNAVAEKIGWGKPAPQGVYRGLAHMKAFGAYVAAAAEISVEGGGNKIKIHRIVAATDPGYVVNPAQVERQVAGSFVYGLSALFLQECTVKDGRIVAGELRHLRLDAHRQMPKVESIIMPTGGTEPVGRRRRADDLRGGTGGAQRLLQGDGQAHPLVPAEEPQDRHGVSDNRGRPVRPPLSPTLVGSAAMRATRASLVVAVILRVDAGMAVAAASPEPPAGASSCSGCHAAAPASTRPCRGSPAAAPPRSSRRCRPSRPGRSRRTVMDRIAKGFTDAEIQAIADWYAQQK